MLITRPTRRWRLAAVVVAAAAALGVAGCGGGEDSTGSEPGNVASFIPATAPVYAEFSTDLEGPQWTLLKALLAKFPDIPNVDTALREGLSAEGVNWDTDVKPLLGKSAAIGLLKLPKTDALASIPVPGGTTSLPTPSVPDVQDQSLILAVEVAEGQEQKVTDLITKDAAPSGKVGDVQYYVPKGETQPLIAVTDGAVLIASKEADLTAGIEAHNGGADRTIAGTTKVTDTLTKLPAEVFAQAYLDVGSIIKQAASGNAQLQQVYTQLGLGADTAIGFSISAEAKGIRLKGVTTGANTDILAGSTSFTPALTQNVPGDSVAYVGIADLTGQAERTLDAIAKSNPDLTKQLDAVTGQLPLLLGGVGLDDLKALGRGEVAVVVTKGKGFPAVSALLQVPDGAQAQKVFDGLAKAAPLLAAQAGSLGAGVGSFKPVEEGGIAGSELEISEQADLVYGVKDNLAVIGSQRSSLGLLASPVTNLAQDPEFTAATAGVPDKVTALLWLDVPGLVEMVEGLDAGATSTDEAKKAIANLGSLKSLVAWGSVEDGTPTVEAFLTIE